VGDALFLSGFILWGVAVGQLMMGFPKGQLVTTGAYSIVRNPIYSSVTVFILPAVTFITMTWVYLVPAIFLYIGVMTFIGKEEEKLTEVFGSEYEEYITKVDRMIPFKKPSFR
jgi:protein-S-isoprenylcysteine O-methyltransferase Ste14